MNIISKMMKKKRLVAELSREWIPSLCFKVAAQPTRLHRSLVGLGKSEQTVGEIHPQNGAISARSHTPAALNLFKMNSFSLSKLKHFANCFGLFRSRKQQILSFYFLPPFQWRPLSNLPLWRCFSLQIQDCFSWDFIHPLLSHQHSFDPFGFIRMDDNICRNQRTLKLLLRDI